MLLSAQFVSHLAEARDFDLRDARDVALDGVLQRDNAQARRKLGDLLQQRVDGRGLARAGRADQYEHPCIRAGEAQQAVHDVIRQAEFIERARLDQLGRQAHGRADAQGRGDGGHAHLQRLIAAGQDGAQSAFLRDVQPVGQKLGHDHQTVDEAPSHRRVIAAGGLQQAVDAQAKLIALRCRLKVNVGRSLSQGGGEDFVNKLPGIGLRGLLLRHGRDCNAR